MSTYEIVPDERRTRSDMMGAKTELLGGKILFVTAESTSNADLCTLYSRVRKADPSRKMKRGRRALDGVAGWAVWLVAA